MPINKCDICGAIEPIPYKCKWCGGVFCGEHRLPEKHDCLYRFNKKYYYDNPKIEKPSPQIIRRPQTRYKPKKQQYKPYRKNIFIRIYRSLKWKLKKSLNLIVFLVIVSLFSLLMLYGYYEYENAPYHTVSLKCGPNTYLAYPNGSTCYITEVKNATDPTYSQLITFLREDQTEQNPYIPGQYVCINFATELHDNAERSLIKAHIIDIAFAGNPDGHTIVGFNTTDKGWIYIDDTGQTIEDKMMGAPSVDCYVDLKEGQQYIPQYLFQINTRWFNLPMGTISSIQQLS